ncbi:MAG: hypothetical protein GTO71_05525 [Woeseiaceae bacterium]|nr:hypothetical protein [Woeseiaceae bacterium]NIP20558.1 hypothetical protein [Woeseiaceae bacterium]NIS89351.1 hypothetical protein [Woeseiaceae bacterium]
MSADKTAVIGCLVLGASLALAADEEMPNPEFLEYLGTWEESDEDWLIFDEPVTADAEEERSEPAPEGEDSTEKMNES